jgi:hypothetical protein
VLTAAGASVDTLPGGGAPPAPPAGFDDDEGLGVVDCCGGGTTVDLVGVGVATGALVESPDSTSMRPWPLRMPSVAVTLADLFAVYAAEAVAGVRAGSRSLNDEPDTVTETVTSVRLAKRTQPPRGTVTDETSKLTF